MVVTGLGKSFLGFNPKPETLKTASVTETGTNWQNCPWWRACVFCQVSPGPLQNPVTSVSAAFLFFSLLSLAPSLFFSSPPLFLAPDSWQGRASWPLLNVRKQIKRRGQEVWYDIHLQIWSVEERSQVRVVGLTFSQQNGELGPVQGDGVCAHACVCVFVQGEVVHFQ